MTTNQELPDSVPSPVVDVSRIRTSMYARWDERNEQLIDVLRSSAERPTLAEAQVRQLLEQGININARDGNRWHTLQFAEYFHAPMRIRDMLAYACEEGSAAVNTPNNTVTREVQSMNDPPDDRAKCGQCERDVGAIFCCSERLSGHCPFVEKWTGNVFIYPTWWIFALASVLAIGGFFVKSMWAGWATLVLLVITFVLFGITRETRLYNAQAHVRLQRTTVAGIEWNYRWSWEVGLPVSFEPTPRLAYPPSISAIYSLASLSGIRDSNAPAVTIFRAALIGLLTTRHIEAEFFRSYAVTKIKPAPTVVDSYVVLIQRHTEGFEHLGVLEQRILRAVAHRLIQSVSEDSTEGLRLYEVVRAVYKEDQSNPSAWVADLVANDAAMKIAWTAARGSKLQEEGKIAQSLSEQLYNICPEFSRVLDIEISRAILSRTVVSGGE